MNKLIYKLKKFDWLMITSAMLLSIIGLVSIFSSSIRDENFLNFNKQLIFFGTGLVIMFLIAFSDWRALRDNPYTILIMYFVCVILLLGLLFFAPTTRGIRGWYKVGFLAIDPIEAIKMVLIILLAKYFSMRHVEMYRLRHIIFSGIYVFIPAFLIYRQPDLGSVIIIVGLWIVMLLISGIKLKHFIVLCLCGLVLITSSWFFLLKPYQKERIVSFLVPQIEPLGISWSQNQSKIAIGSGGFFGQGFGKGSQTQYGFLPEPHTDFIFSAISEEFGFIGVSAIFILFFIIAWRVTKIAMRASSNFCRLFCIGFVAVIMFQIFIHVGMNTSISPVIGISLPFVSYGGSGLLAFFASIGFIQSIKTQ